MVNKTEKALLEIKEVLNTNFEPNWINYGPMRLKKSTFRDSKGKARNAFDIDAGWDNNYGGHIRVESSPTGKSLTVIVSEEVNVVKD